MQGEETVFQSESHNPLPPGPINCHPMTTHWSSRDRSDALDTERAGHL